MWSPVQEQEGCWCLCSDDAQNPFHQHIYEGSRVSVNVQFLRRHHEMISTWQTWNIRTIKLWWLQWPSTVYGN